MSGKNNDSWIPKIGEEYYIPKNGSYTKYRNTGTAWDEFMISDCVVFKTKEEAIECAKKIVEKERKKNKMILGRKLDLKEVFDSFEKAESLYNKKVKDDTEMLDILYDFKNEFFNSIEYHLKDSDDDLYISDLYARYKEE